MDITFDPAKCEWTLRERGLNFEEAVLVSEDLAIDIPDLRLDFGEPRIITVGHLRGRMMVIVWTPRGDAHHVISMRKANDREQKAYGRQIPENRERHGEG